MAKHHAQRGAAMQPASAVPQAAASGAAVRLPANISQGFHVSIRIRRDDDAGQYIAEAPSLPGCQTTAPSLDQVRAQILKLVSQALERQLPQVSNAAGSGWEEEQIQFVSSGVGPPGPLPNPMAASVQPVQVASGGSKDRSNVVPEQGKSTEMATKDEVAIELARKHYLVEPGLIGIYRIADKVEITDNGEVEVNRAEPIKLLEVNQDTVPAGVMPLRFGPMPASGIPYSSVIVEVTPDEFEKIKAKELSLPNGWTIGDPIPKTTGNGG
jgi:predicted RNase H-like HicB family nuclease